MAGPARLGGGHQDAAPEHAAAGCLAEDRGLPAKQVTPAHVLDVLKTALKKNGLSVAAEAKRTMSAVFELAVSTLRADSDPVYPLRKALPANKTQRKRPLTTEEVGLLLRQLDGYKRNFQTVSVFRLMWLTLCRPNEAIGAQWKEIDLEHAVGRIPPERRITYRGVTRRQACTSTSIWTTRPGSG